MESDADRQKLEEAIQRFDVPPIIERFGTWAVTTYGVESLESFYPIEFKRVDESDWLDHMRDKTWVDIGDFSVALSYARQLYGMRRTFMISDRPLKVFLCHGTEDKSSVRHIYHRLQSVGIEPWLDEEQLLPGQDWKFEITRAVRQSDIILVCLSRTSVGKTGFVQKEIKDALDAADERPEGMIFLIPARLEECEVPDRLRGRQWVDLFNPRGFDLLLKSLEIYCAPQQKT